MTNRLKNRNIWSAEDIQKIVERNAPWFRTLVVEGVKATQRSGRPLYTERIPEDERLAALLQAPAQFWDALASSDMETAVALAASVIKARTEGKIPDIGPRADDVTPEDAEEEPELDDV